MTYKEDVEAVKGSFREMLEKKVYLKDLFEDLQVKKQILLVDIRNICQVI